MLTIHPATSADIPALLPLNAIVQDWHATHYPDRFRQSVDPEYVHSFFEMMIEGDTSFVDLALWDAAPAGYMFSRLNATSKKHLLQELAQRAEDILGVKARVAFEAMLERERLGATGMGNGVAIPHGRFSELDQICGVFVKLDKPVNYDSIDDQPVDLIFLLLAPEEAGADHLKALAKISRIFRDQATCEKLRGADNSDAIYAILNSVQ